MGATTILDAIASQDDDLVMGMGFEEHMSLIIDEAYSSFSHSKVEELIRRAGLRYPEADQRRIDLVKQRGLNQDLLVSLATCGFIERHQKVVFQGFTGSGKIVFRMRTRKTSLPTPLPCTLYPDA